MDTSTIPDRKLNEQLLAIRSEYVYYPGVRTPQVEESFKQKAKPIIDEVNKRFTKVWEKNGKITKQPIQITFDGFFKAN